MTRRDSGSGILRKTRKRRKVLGQKKRARQAKRGENNDDSSS